MGFDRLYGRWEGAWRRADRKKRLLLYLCAYTLAFLPIILIAYGPFFDAGKTFVLDTDGLDQHYPLMIYVGQLVRGAVRGLLHGDFPLRLYDINSDFGDDIIGLLNGLGWTDPLALLAAFVPLRYSEHLYAFLCFFRLYLAGLSFSYLCACFGKRKLYTLIGSIVYVFSGYGYASAIRHPYFVNPMIILPLLIVGTEKVLRKQRPYLFTAAVLYGVLCGYYHLYMMTLMALIYAVVRFFSLYKKDRGREFLRALGRGSGAYALGIGLPAVVLVPAVAEFLNCARVGTTNYAAPTYDLGYFRDRILRMFAPTPNATGLPYPSFAALALFALGVMFASRKNRPLKQLTVIALLSFYIDLGNLAMNGFQYPSQRWTFGLALVIAYVVVEYLPELMHLRPRLRLLCVVDAALYILLAYSSPQARALRFSTVGAALVLVTVLVLAFAAGPGGKGTAAQQKRTAARRGELRALVCLVLVIGNVCVDGYYKAAPAHGDLVSYYSPFGSAYGRLLASPERALAPYLQGDLQGRADGSTFTRRTSLLFGFPGMLGYSAVMNKNAVEFWDQLESTELDNAFSILSSGQRTIVNTLLSEKYHVEPSSDTARLPYGYTLLAQTGAYGIYENSYALPWGYTYENTITYDELAQLNGLEKQQAMLQAVALEDAGAGAPAATVTLDSTALPYQMECDGCTWEDGVLKVSKKGGTIKLRFAMPAAVEGYLRLCGFSINGSGQKAFYVTADAGCGPQRVYAVSDTSEYYSGREEYLFNLGYSAQARGELAVTFDAKGTYRLEGIELYALPMDDYPARVEALRAEPLENIEWGADRLSGTVDLSKDKILCVSVPYSAGWTAAVDGEKVEILRGNYMFMCLPLSAGHHDIVFRYRPPGRGPGAVLTLCSAGIVAWMLLRDRKRQKPRR